MDLILPKGLYRRANGNLPPFELVNMLAEPTLSVRGGVSLLSFPGLAVSVERGAGPIHGIYRRADLFSGSIFVVSDQSLFKDGTNLGALSSGPPYVVSWASINDDLIVSRGSDAYAYNPTDGLDSIGMPDGFQTTAVAALAGRGIYVRKNSYRFYWSDILDARTVDALSYASAESAPDYLLDACVVGDVLYLGGRETIEAWYPSGDPDLPFQRITQRTAQKGVPFTGCMVALDNALHFVGSDRCVYRMAEVPQRISHAGIEEALAAATTIRCFTMVWEGHSILYVRTDTKTFGFDVGTSEWHERQTFELSNWVVNCCAQQEDGTPIFGSAVGNDLLIHSGWAEGTSALVREWTAAIPLNAATRIDAVEIDANTGAAPELAGDDPEVEMAYSRDRGNTFSEYRRASLGAQGEYRRRPRWTRLGMFDAPGALLKFRVSDPTGVRVSGVTGDESAAGPSRIVA